MSVRDVVCIGEALVDFLPEQAGRRVRDVTRWTRCSGGSPANVAIGVSRLGGRSALLGVVGEDEFGHFLREELEREGVDVSRLRLTEEGKTGLAFVSLGPDGERSFSFYRTRSAEFFLDRRDVDRPFVVDSRVVHCGSNLLSAPGALEAVLALLSAAQDAGRIISCDPNLRLRMWSDLRMLEGVVRQVVSHCTVVKVSTEEIEMVTGRADVEGALEVLASRGVALPIVTAGPEGAAFLWRGELIRVPAPTVEALDTTGAGDGFMAALLTGLSRRFSTEAELLRADQAMLEELATFACAAGARVAQHLGAVAGLPRLDEVRTTAPAWLAQG